MLGRLATLRQRTRRGLLLSSLRAAIFNQVLAQRVIDGSWNRICEGEAAMLDGTGSFFSVGRVDEQLNKRLDDMDIHPSDPMAGLGDSKVLAKVLVLEQTVEDELSEWAVALQSVGLKKQRRALRLVVKDLQLNRTDSHTEGDTFTISFELARGCYATSVLREIIDIAG